MIYYRSSHILRHWMPDDRLAWSTIEDDGFTFHLRAGRIAPALVAQVRDLSAATAALGLFDLAVDGTPRAGPGVVAYFGLSERIELPMEVLVRCNGGFEFEIALRSDMVDPALLRELNEEAMPRVAGLLAPATLTRAG